MSSNKCTRQHCECRKPKSGKGYPKSRSESVLSLDRSRNSWMYEDQMFSKNSASLHMEQNGCKICERHAAKGRDMETQTSCRFCACHCTCEHRHEVVKNRQVAGHNSEGDAMTKRCSSEEVSFFDLSRKRLRYVYHGIYVTTEYLLKQQKAQKNALKQKNKSRRSSSLIESESSDAYAERDDIEYSLEYDVEDGEENDVNYYVEDNVGYDVEDNIEYYAEEDVEFESSNDMSYEVTISSDFKLDDDLSFAASRSPTKCSSEVSRDCGGRERPQRSTSSGYLHLLSKRNESVLTPDCLLELKERYRPHSLSPRYCTKSFLNMMQTLPRTSKQSKQSACICRHCTGSRQNFDKYDCVTSIDNGSDKRSTQKQEEQQKKETCQCVTKARAKSKGNECDCEFDPGRSYSRPETSNPDAIQGQQSTHSSAESLLELRSTNTLTDVWHRAGLLEGRTYMKESNALRRRGGLCTHAVLQQAVKCDLDVPSKGDRELEMTIRLLQLRDFQSLADAHFKRYRRQNECCDIKGASPLKPVSHQMCRCPLDKVDCPFLINEEFLGHVLTEHISEPGIELREIFEGDRLLLVINPRAFQLGKNSCLSVLAYGGFRGLNEVPPIRHYTQIINANLPTPFSQFSSHLPMMLMICRTTRKAADGLGLVRNKRVHFADEPLELYTNMGNRDLVTLWVVSLEQPKPIYVMLTVFDKNMTATRTSIVRVQNLLKPDDIIDFIGQDSNRMRLTDADVSVLSNFDDDAMYLELTMREY